MRKNKRDEMQSKGDKKEEPKQKIYIYIFYHVLNNYVCNSNVQTYSPQTKLTGLVCFYAFRVN